MVAEVHVLKWFFISCHGLRLDLLEFVILFPQYLCLGVFVVYLPGFPMHVKHHNVKF